MNNTPKNDTPNKALVEAVDRLRDVQPRQYLYQFSDPVSGRPVWRASASTWNGQIPGATEALYSVEQIAAALSQPQHGGLVEAIRKAAANAEADRGEVRLHASDWMRVMDVLNSPVVGDEKGITTNDTPTDTADRREEDIVDRLRENHKNNEATPCPSGISNDVWQSIPAYLRPSLAKSIASLIAVPDGMCIVPREPTEAMIFAGDDAAAGPQDLGEGLTRAIWSAMIAAATGEA